MASPGSSTATSGGRCSGASPCCTCAIIACDARCAGRAGADNRLAETAARGITCGDDPGDVAAPRGIPCDDDADTAPRGIPCDEVADTAPRGIPCDGDADADARGIPCDCDGDADARGIPCDCDGDADVRGIPCDDVVRAITCGDEPGDTAARGMPCDDSDDADGRDGTAVPGAGCWLARGAAGGAEATGGDVGGRACLPDGSVFEIVCSLP